MILKEPPPLSFSVPHKNKKFNFPNLSPQKHIIPLSWKYAATGQTRQPISDRGDFQQMREKLLTNEEGGAAGWWFKHCAQSNQLISDNTTMMFRSYAHEATQARN